MVKISETAVSVIVQNGSAVLTHEGKQLMAKIGIDKKSGKESLVYYPVRSMKYVNGVWNFDVDEEHQIPVEDAVALLYGTRPRGGSFLLPVAMRSKTGDLILGFARAVWKIKGKTGKLLPLPESAIPAAVFEETVNRKNQISNKTPQLLPFLKLPSRQTN